MQNRKSVNHKGKGSVSRAFNYEKKAQNKKYKEKMNALSRKYKLRSMKKINKRCIECGKLISPKSTRCKACSIISNHNKYLEGRR